MTTPAQPAVTVSLDQASYNLNDPITVTAEYTDPAAAGNASELVVTVTVSYPDGTTASGEASAAVSTGAQTATAPAAASDNAGNTYTEQSNVNGTVVFTGTVAQAPPAA
jgi:hypothetical protein